MNPNAVLAGTILEVMSHMSNSSVQTYIDVASDLAKQVVLLIDVATNRANMLVYEGPPLPLPIDPCAHDFVGKVRLSFAVFNATRCFRGYMYVVQRHPTAAFTISPLETLRDAVAAHA